MVYGVIKNGVVEFEGSIDLCEGTRVRIEPIESIPAKGSSQAILDRLQPWCGEDGELEELDKDVQRLRDLDTDHERKGCFLTGTCWIRTMSLR